MTAKLPLLLTLLLSFAFSLAAEAQTKIGPTVGSSIENFSLEDQSGASKTLGELLSKGPTVIFTVRSAGWCEQSKDHLLLLQQQLESLDAVGLQIACLSYDNVEVIRNFAARNGIGFTLLSDPESKVLRQLKLVNTKFKQGTLRYAVAVPATLLIDRTGTVISVTDGLLDPASLLKRWNPKPTDSSVQNAHPNFITIQGNNFVDQQGAQVRFKGVAIADILKIIRDGNWNREHFSAIKKWGANIVRIPVHPGNFRKLGKERYLKFLDQAIGWCEEYKMHVIIDWHSIGNLRTNKFEAADKVTSLQETLSFWNLVSKRYSGNPTVAFYEIFNEPARTYKGHGECTWLQWKRMAEKIIDTIRANDQRTIALVAGFDWGYDLREAAADPISRENIAYVAHPYPGKCSSPREPHWEKHFGFLANRFPVFVTETGFYPKGEFENYVDRDGTFRNAILKYLDRKEISWCAWVFDPDWTPPLIDSYDYTPTVSGNFFRNAMLEHTEGE